MLRYITYDIFQLPKADRSILVHVVIAHDNLGDFLEIFHALLHLRFFLGIEMIEDTLHDGSHFLKVQFPVLIHVKTLDQLPKKHVINAV